MVDTIKTMNKVIKYVGKLHLSDRHPTLPTSPNTAKWKVVIIKQVSVFVFEFVKT